MWCTTVGLFEMFKRMELAARGIHSCGLDDAIFVASLDAHSSPVPQCALSLTTSMVGSV